MSEIQKDAQNELENEIIRIKKIKEEYDALVSDLKKKQQEYQKLINILKAIKDGLLSGKLQKKQIKLFQKICEQKE